MPHVSFVRGSQVPGLPGPLEQHLKQCVPLQTQTPLTQAFSLATQSTVWSHGTPFAPQVLSELGWHVPGVPGPLEQHPAGQLVASQTHRPPAHRCPVGHATQIAPLLPQSRFVGGETQRPVAVSQQPFGQLVALQTQSPLTQTVPAGQFTHCSPPAPQVVFELCWQAPKLPGPLVQQPLGQLSALQTQFPPTQVVVGGHSSQSSPPAPQFWLVFPGVMQGPVAVSQQPLGQLCALQTQTPSALQTVPSGQATHCTPLRPHAVSKLGWQVPGFPGPLEQHPAGQLCAVQRQAVPSSLQTVLGGQRFSQLPPQPSGPQTLPAQVRVQHVPWGRLQTQVRKSGQSSSLRQLPAHAAGTHAPSTHACCAVHWAHVPPLLPQAPSVFPGRQRPPASQQPSRQLRRVHRHWPLSSSQVSPAGQAPQPPSPPQPSGPHARPAQFGAQQSPSGLHWSAPGAQQRPSQQCVAHRAFGLGPSKTIS
jgi:hypothetical protein